MCERGHWEDVQTQRTHSHGAGFLVSCEGQGQFEALSLETASCEAVRERAAVSHTRDAIFE